MAPHEVLNFWECSFLGGEIDCIEITNFILIGRYHEKWRYYRKYGTVMLELGVVKNSHLYIQVKETILNGDLGGDKFRRLIKDGGNEIEGPPVRRPILNSCRSKAKFEFWILNVVELKLFVGSGFVPRSRVSPI